MQIGIDFEKLGTNTESAVRALRLRLERAGIGIVDIASTGQNKRSAGVTYREVVVNLRDNQSVTLRVTKTGDVFQVLVNGKVTPIAAQDATSAVNELSLILDRSRAARQKRLAAMQIKPPPAAKTAAPRMEVALRQQITEVDARIAEAEQELAALQAE